MLPPATRRRGGKAGVDDDAATAFFTFFATLIHEGAAHRVLAEACYDVETAAARAGYDVSDRLRSMLARAQQVGAVRAGITYPDVKALMAGCLSRESTTRMAQR